MQQIHCRPEPCRSDTSNDDAYNSDISPSLYPGRAEPLRVVKELFVIPDKLEFILYSPAAGSLIRVNGAAVELLRCIANNTINIIDVNPQFVKDMRREGILIGYDEPQPALHFPRKTGSFDPKSITLFLSTRCNLACSYCYASGGENPTVLAEETAHVALEWIAEHQKRMGRKNLAVMFHGGGEVTTAKKLLRSCVDEAQRQAKFHGLTTQFNAGLNGVMGSNMLEWVVDKLNGATLSVDGLPEVHDAARPLPNGQGSFDKVAATLDYMDKKNFQYGIRSTVTEDSLPLLDRSVEFMARRFGAKIIQVEPVFPVGRGVLFHSSGIDPLYFIEKFRQARHLAAKYGTELKYSGARFQAVTNRFCGIGDDSFAVSTEGLLTACYEVGDTDDVRSERFVFGQIDVKNRNVLIENEKLERLRGMTVEHKPHCQNCFCKWHCAGDCAAKLALDGDPMDTSDSPRCQVNRELTLDQIRMKLDSSRRHPG